MARIPAPTTPTSQRPKGCCRSVAVQSSGPPPPAARSERHPSDAHRQGRVEQAVDYVVGAFDQALRVPALVVRVEDALEKPPRRVSEKTQGDQPQQAPPERGEQDGLQSALLPGRLAAPPNAARTDRTPTSTFTSPYAAYPERATSSLQGLALFFARRAPAFAPRVAPPRVTQTPSAADRTTSTS